MFRLLPLAALLSGVAAGGCRSPGFLSDPVFFYPEGNFYTSSDVCKGASNTCAFSGPYEYGNSVAGASVTITCPILAPGQFLITVTAKVLGVSQTESATAPTGACASALVVSANIVCKPGLLIFLIPGLLLLSCIGCCYCCCCRRSQGGGPASTLIVIGAGATAAGYEAVPQQPSPQMKLLQPPQYQQQQYQPQQYQQQHYQQQQYQQPQYQQPGLSMVQQYQLQQQQQQQQRR